MIHSRRVSHVFSALLGIASAMLQAEDQSAPKIEPNVSGPTGLSMYPGVFMVQGIPPGYENLDLAEVSPATAITVFNRAKEPFGFHFETKAPLQLPILRWERGYEPIPDASWISMREENVDVPAESEAKTGLILNVPEGDEWYNRKFVGVFVLTPKVESIGGLGMALAGRILFETEVNPDVMSGAPIALQPPVLELGQQKRGAKTSALVKVKNNTDQSVKYHIGRITDVVKRVDTFDRFVSNGSSPLVNNSWVKTEPHFSLKAGETTTLKLDINVPDDAAIGKPYEELVFIESVDGKPTGNDREPGGPTTFIRVKITPETP